MRLTLPALAAVALLAPGCCTFKGWFGMLGYEVGVVADADANNTGDTRLFLLWVSPKYAGERAAALKNIQEAQRQALDWRNEGEAEFVDLGSFGVGVCRPTHIDFQSGAVRLRSARLCHASRLYVFSDMVDPKNPAEPERRLVKEVVLETPVNPYTPYMGIHINRENLEVRFLPTEDALYLFLFRPSASRTN